MKVIRENSPYYEAISKNSTINKNNLMEIDSKITDILNLWNDGNDPACIDVLNAVIETKLFDVSDNLKIISESTNAEIDIEDDSDTKLNAIEEALKAPFSEVFKYIEYISGNAKFSTHQGVKGLEFPRVAVIIDDKEAEAFRIFSYDKMFGIVEKSDTDIANELEGKETTLDRTKRLLYVTCSRAEESLAIIYYTDDINSVEESIKQTGWFIENEIEKIDDLLPLTAENVPFS